MCCYSSPPSRDGGSWLNVIGLRVAYAWRSDRMHVAARELRITLGSPLCIGLTRAIYILCIEHLRMLHLSGNRTRDLLHCRRTLYAKSHSNGVSSCHSGSQHVLLQYNGREEGHATLFCCRLICFRSPHLSSAEIGRARICKCLRSLGIDSKESIPPGYIGWQI
jgi:hypothetical protein